MLVYWVLFAFAATMALIHRESPVGKPFAGRIGTEAPYYIFALIYVGIGGLRYQTGGDWYPYLWKFTQISYSSLAFSIDYTDPLYGMLNWIVARIGGEIYLVNAVVCLILVTGVIRVARLTRDPWLAILIAVPYVLIVIGMGYVRQAAAIGVLLMALASLERKHKFRSIFYLVLAAGFHTTSLVVASLFVVAGSKRFNIYSIVTLILSVIAYLFLLEPRLGELEARYIIREYQSEGTLVRLAMSAIPGLLLLVRWRHFDFRGPSRPVWLLIALGSLAILAAYFISPSSTAVDRIGLYFSIVQIIVFGELLYLLDFKKRDSLYLRAAAIALVMAVQAVWLTSAMHFQYWVPYRSVLGSF
jgi:hypothetical protein